MVGDGITGTMAGDGITGAVTLGTIHGGAAGDGTGPSSSTVMANQLQARLHWADPDLLWVQAPRLQIRV